METATASSTKKSFARRISPGSMGRRAKALREDLGPAEVKEEVKEAKARPAVARRASVGPEASVVREGRAEGNVARVDRLLEDRRRVGLAEGAPGWGRRARSALWSVPCRSTPTATASSTATN
jgi:hypothetical protein